MSTDDELRASPERILDAAAKLMAERGYVGTSISAICAASGLPPSSVYWHFRSKEGVLRAVLERSGANALADFSAPGEAADVREVLETIGRFVGAASENLRFLMVLGLREGRATEQTLEVLRDVRGKVRGWLETELARSYSLPPGDPLAKDLAAIVIAVANGLLLGSWVEENEPELPVEQLEIALAALVTARR
jgi:AcrR family transcriptional regulator